MKILVTGSTGSFGARVVETLLKRPVTPISEALNKLVSSLSK